MSGSETRPTKLDRHDIPAIGLAIAGLTASFAAASCCALPLILAGVGISGGALLGGLAIIAALHRGLLLALAVVCLGAAAALLSRAPARPDASGGRACPRSRVRQIAWVGLMFGTVLLVLGYAYA